MRVAALYDVHANLPALEAALADVAAASADAIVCGGDVVWGPDPGGCLERLRAAGALLLRGNCERRVLAAEDEADAWCLGRLNEEQRAFIAGPPETLQLEVDGIGPVLFCHSSPRSDAENLTEATPDQLLAELLARVDAALVVCGHTHHQLDRRADGKRVVNAGSVGLPYEGARGAYWTLLGPDVEPRRTLYDVEAALPTLRESGFPGAEGLLPENLRGLQSKAEAVRFIESLRGA
jgi:predicted phosphodiesterase